MARHQLFVLALLLGLVAHSVSVAQQAESENSNGTDTAKVESLVSALGDPDPAIRKNAESAILNLGYEALPEIKAGIQNSNLEVNRRCKILLEKIELQQKKRIADIFLAPEYTGSNRFRFPAWPAFAEFTGSKDLRTRKLFLKMCDQLPAVFKDYGIKGEQTALALKKMSRLILGRGKNRKASSESVVIAYLFLAESAHKANSKNEAHSSNANPDAESDEPFFSKVEMLEAVTFFSNNNHASVGRYSENRKLIDRALADWVMENVTFEGDGSRLKLIYQTSNLNMIADLEEAYESLEPADRLKFVDIVSLAFSKNGKAELDQIRTLLEKPLADESVVVHSRIRARPGEKVDLTVQLLAQAVLAKSLKRCSPSGEPIELESVFGSFPMSHASFSIIKNEKDRELLIDQVQARIRNSDAVK